MIYSDESKILDLIKEYSSNRRVLIIKDTPEDYVQSSESGNALEVTSNDGEDPVAFLDLCKSTSEVFDLIVIHSDAFKDIEDFKIQETHADLIRDVMRSILEDAGILLFIVRENDFVISGYIKPGADKLTKKMIPEELKESKPFQIWAFYN
jgi:hypothetical protein